MWLLILQKKKHIPRGTPLCERSGRGVGAGRLCGMDRGSKMAYCIEFSVIRNIFQRYYIFRYYQVGCLSILVFFPCRLWYFFDVSTCSHWINFFKEHRVCLYRIAMYANRWWFISHLDICFVTSVIFIFDVFTFLIFSESEQYCIHTRVDPSKHTIM